MDGNNNEFPQGEPSRGGDANGGSEEVLENNRPAVAAAPAKTLVLVVLGLVFVGIVVKSLFFSKPPETVVKSKLKDTVATADQAPPINISPNDLPKPPSPAAQMPIAPPPPPPEPQAIAPPAPPPVITAQTGPTNEQLKARIHAPMLIASSSSAPGGTSENTTVKKPPATDPNSAWAQGFDGTKAETVTATKVSNLDRSILQGKFIPGILETAIDSTLPAPIRAIVSHDVYAESGRNILIPKGSRIIGVYNAAIKRGQGRVFIIWTRIIRPDGVDIAIDSPGVDALGRGGMGGYVDNRYFEAFSTAILTSSIDVAVAAIGDALFGNQDQTTSVGPGGTSTVQSSPTSTAMQTAIQNIGTVGQTIIGNAVNLEPIIHIDQGQQINIFVNKDVVFPSELVNNTPGIIP